MSLRTGICLRQELGGVPSAMVITRMDSPHPLPTISMVIAVERVRVLVVDDQTIIRRAVISLLNSIPHLDVVGEAADLPAAVEAVDARRPAVVLVNVDMQRLSGVEAVRQIRTSYPGLAVLAMCTGDEHSCIARAFEAGASGYLAATVGAAELAAAIDTVRRGDLYLSPSVARVLVQDYLGRSTAGRTDEPGLTSLDRSLIKMTAEGHSAAQIASTLQISPRRVYAHRERLLKRLGLRRAADLVRFAVRSGFVKA